MADDDDSEKPYEPTPRKLEEARKKGDIPRSTDLNVAVTYGGMLVALALAGPWMTDRLGTLLSVLLAQPDRLAPLMQGDRAVPLMGGLLGAAGLALAPVFAVPAVAVLLGLVVQRAIVVAPDKLAFKLNRISPLANAKNKFGRNGLFEFGKSGVKLVIFSVLLGGFLTAKAGRILGVLRLEPAAVSGQIAALGTDFLGFVLLVAGAIATVDVLWQFAEHRRRHMMSRQELIDETKQSEGDPHMKQQRRQRGQEIAMNRMLAEVPSADVVIVNPTHYAVALKWSRLAGAAPVCVAKGTDHAAARIREAAAAAGVPVHRDPPTARAIYANVDIGREIRPEDYRAVALAIRFAEDMRRKARWTTAKN